MSCHQNPGPADNIQDDPFEMSQKEMETLQKRIRFITS
jgi:hypothetical protein